MQMDDSGGNDDGDVAGDSFRPPSVIEELSDAGVTNVSVQQSNASTLNEQQKILEQMLQAADQRSAWREKAISTLASVPSAVVPQPQLQRKQSQLTATQPHWKLHQHSSPQLLHASQDSSTWRPSSPNQDPATLVGLVVGHSRPGSAASAGMRAVHEGTPTNKRYCL